jgi:hypothetical protein
MLHMMVEWMFPGHPNMTVLKNIDGMKLSVDP